MWDHFFSELKRRRVIRVAGVYAVTCWAIFQVVAALFPVLHLPAWTVTLAAVLLMLGFPIALIIAWAFESAEGGVRRTKAARKGAAPLKVGWGDWALMAAAVAIIGLSAAQMTGLVPSLGVRGGAGADASAPQKSVAVMPFANFSSQKDADLFADGMTEEVINGLAQIPQLKVAGRTSTFYFKGRNDDLRVIGRKLGVSHVLEGSIRQEGDHLRVTVQLIKVSDGFHVWSETYDRTMSDAFAIQSDISARVAEVLRAKLAIDGPRVGVRLDPQAYGAALVARAQLRRMGLADLTAARAAFKTLIDGGDVDAGVYAGYAQATLLLAQDHLALDFNEADRDAGEAITKGLALDPKSPEVQTARGFRCLVRLVRLADQACAAEAQTAFDTAVQLAPRDPDVLVYAANFQMRRADPVRGLAMLKQAVEIDPLNRVALMLLAGAESDVGRWAEAEARYRAVIDLYPDLVGAKQDLGTTLFQEGKLDQAEPWLRAAAEPGTDPTAGLQLAHLYLNLGMIDRYNATLDRMKEPPVIANLGVAIRKLVAGDYAGTHAFAAQRYAADHDPIWLSAIADTSLQTGDYEGARRIAVQALPALFEPEPQVDVSLADEASRVAFVLDRLGDKAQSRRIIERVLAVTAPKPGVVQHASFALARAKAYATLGDNDHAIAELKGAVDGGFRSLWDFNTWIRLDAEPPFATLKTDPRFQALVRQIETDNARMKAALLART